MKKILITLIALLLTSSLNASKTEQEKLSSDMRDMLRAMELIQQGGFYSNMQLMHDGIAQLKRGLSSLDTTNAEAYLPDNQKYANKFASKRAKMIAMYADDITASLEAKNMDDALEDYSQILRQCTSCHIRIRTTK